MPIAPTRIASAALLAGSLLLLYGCSDTLTSKKLGSALPATRDSYGVPYTLTKPQFTITSNPPTATNPVQTYSLKLEVVPDPSQRYEVRVNRGSMSEQDLEFVLGARGNIVSTYTESREQITPTIKAVGDFVTGAIGAAAKVAGVGVLAGQSSPVDLAKAEITKRLDHTVAEVKKNENVDLDPASKTIQTRYAGKKARTERELAEALAPRTDDERRLVKSIAEPIDADAQAARQAYQTELATPLTPPPADPSAPASVTDEWARVRAEVADALRREDLALLIKFQGRELNPNAPTVTAAWLQEVKTRSRDLATKAQALAIASTSFPTLIPPLIAGDGQLYRHVKRLLLLVSETELRIADLNEQERLLIDKGSKPSDADRKTVIDARAGAIDARERAVAQYYDAIGASTEYAAIAKLKARIENGPGSTTAPAPAAAAGVPAVLPSPMGEYQLALQEWTALQESVAGKLAKVAAAAAPKADPKPPEWDPKPVDIAYLWNREREQMEKVAPPGPPPPPPPRLLIFPNTGGASPQEEVGNEVVRKFGFSPQDWPNFVVVLERSKP